MRTSIDKSGRLVIPRALRDQIGLAPGDVDVFADGAALRVVPLAGDDLAEREGRLVIPAGGAVVTGDDVQELRDADQR